MKRQTVENMARREGFELRKHSRTDNRRIRANGVHRWYLANLGMWHQSFKTLDHAAQWLEARESNRDFAESLPR